VIVVVLFALSHGYQGWAGIIDTGVFGGLLLSLTYWWRGMRLAAPIAAHAAWNVIAAFVIFAAY
jgi:membrane protease YdiL (CAAX protease family)